MLAAARQPDRPAASPSLGQRRPADTVPTGHARRRRPTRRRRRHPRRSPGGPCCRCIILGVGARAAAHHHVAAAKRKLGGGFYAGCTVVVALAAHARRRPAVGPGAGLGPHLLVGPRHRHRRPVLDVGTTCTRGRLELRRRRHRRLQPDRSPLLICAAVILAPCSPRLPAPRGPRRPRALRAPAAVGVRRRGHGHGQRPHRAVPRPRDAVDRGLRARRPCTCKRVQSQEAGIKYFVLGAFSSAFFLYGIAMIYGATGTTNLVTIKDFLATQVFAPIAAGRRISTSRSTARCCCSASALLLVGLGFKVAAVPFHFWSPDVYDGVAHAGRWPSWPRRSRPPASPRWSGCSSLTFGTYVDDWRPIVAVARRAVDGRRLAAGHRADQRQADAGVLVDQPRRLHPDGAGRVVARGHHRRCSSTWSPTRSWSPARSRWSRWWPAGRRPHRRSTTTGPVGGQPACWRSPSRLPAGPGRRARSPRASSPSSTRSSPRSTPRRTWLAIVAMVSSVIAAYLYLRIIVAMYMSGRHRGRHDAGADQGRPHPDPARHRRRPGRVPARHHRRRHLPRPGHRLRRRGHAGAGAARRDRRRRSTRLDARPPAARRSRAPPPAPPTASGGPATRRRRRPTRAGRRPGPTAAARRSTDRAPRRERRQPAVAGGRPARATHADARSARGSSCGPARASASAVGCSRAPVERHDRHEERASDVVMPDRSTNWSHAGVVAATSDRGGAGRGAMGQHRPIRAPG